MQALDQVIELDLGCIPEASDPEPLLIQTDNSTFLTFNAQHLTNKGTQPIGPALLEFPRCIITQFGYPNDEALRGHPFYSSGLNHYGIFEVINSSWAQRIDQQNRIAFPRFDKYGSRHFIITFHDSTFECLADNILLKLVDKVYKNIFERIILRIIHE